MSASGVGAEECWEWDSEGELYRPWSHTEEYGLLSLRSATFAPQGA